MFKAFKISSLALLLFCCGAFAFNIEYKPYVFPLEDYEYIAGVDTGYQQYNTPSLKGSRKVALTFDDGPHPTITPKILDVLKEYDAPATFFILGDRINSQTLPIIKRIVKEGHFFSSHDFNHINKNKISETEYKQYLKKAINLTEDTESKLGVVQKEMYYRFPYADYGRTKNYHHLNVLRQVSDEIYGENCINFVFWEIDSADWVYDMTSRDVFNGIVAQIEGGTAYRHKKINGKWRKSAYQVTDPYGGGIVLLHDIQRKNIEAVRLFLEYAKNNNIEIVPLNEVEGYGYDDRICERR